MGGGAPGLGEGLGGLGAVFSLGEEEGDVAGDGLGAGELDGDGDDVVGEGFDLGGELGEE